MDSTRILSSGVQNVNAVHIVVRVYAWPLLFVQTVADYVIETSILKFDGTQVDLRREDDPENFALKVGHFGLLGITICEDDLCRLDADEPCGNVIFGAHLLSTKACQLTRTLPPDAVNEAHIIERVWCCAKQQIRFCNKYPSPPFNLEVHCSCYREQYTDWTEQECIL